MKPQTKKLNKKLDNSLELRIRKIELRLNNIEFILRQAPSPSSVFNIPLASLHYHNNMPCYNNPCIFC